MAAKNKIDEKEKAEVVEEKEETAVPAKVLTSVNEVADELSLGLRTLYSLLGKYPFADIGTSGKLNGRWHVPIEDVWKWYRYVKRQETRHPDSRRMRPEEPPELKNIIAR